MGKIGAYIIALLVGTSLWGTIALLICFVVSKARNFNLDSRAIFKIYKTTLIIISILSIPVLFIPSNISEMASAPSKPSPVLNFLPLILIIGIVLFIRKSMKRVQKAEGGKGMSNNLVYELGSRGESLVRENIHGDKIIVKLQGSFGEGLVITDKRIYVLKWGFMAGNFLGGRCIAFGFNNIVGLEIRKGWATGTFEILTPSTQNTQKTYWGSGENSAIKSDNIVTFQSNKFQIFQEAVRIGRELIHNPHAQTMQGSAPSTNYSDLEKLAELRDKGIITKEEFEIKKKKILDL
jgi:hypothetical protein